MDTFPAGYGRVGRIWIEPGECDICHLVRVCLMMDSSEEEYYAGKICKECIDKLFSNLP